MIRSSIESRETPIASSFRSEIGDSITEQRTPSSTSSSRSAGTAREKPQISALEARGRDQLDRAAVVVGDAREAGLDPVDAEPVEQPGDLELLLGVEHDADGLLAVAERRVVEADVTAEAVRVVQRAGPDQVVAHAGKPKPLRDLAAVGAHREGVGDDEDADAPGEGDPDVVADRLLGEQGADGVDDRGDRLVLGEPRAPGRASCRWARRPS